MEKYRRSADVLEAESEEKANRISFCERTLIFLINLKQERCLRTAVTSNQSRVAADCIDYGLSYSAHMVYSRGKEEKEETHRASYSAFTRQERTEAAKRESGNLREERICKLNSLTRRLIN